MEHTRAVKDEINTLFSQMLLDDKLVRPVSHIWRAPLPPLPRVPVTCHYKHPFITVFQEKSMDFLDKFPRQLLNLKSKLNPENEEDLHSAEELVRGLCKAYTAALSQPSFDSTDEATWRERLNEFTAAVKSFGVVEEVPPEASAGEEEEEKSEVEETQLATHEHPLKHGGETERSCNLCARSGDRYAPYYTCYDCDYDLCSGCFDRRGVISPGVYFVRLRGGAVVHPEFSARPDNGYLSVHNVFERDTRDSVAQVMVHADYREEWGGARWRIEAVDDMENVFTLRLLKPSMDGVPENGILSVHGDNAPRGSDGGAKCFVLENDCGGTQFRFQSVENGCMIRLVGGDNITYGGPPEGALGCLNQIEGDERDSASVYASVNPVSDVTGEGHGYQAWGFEFVEDL
jgi:hypothetical protein